MVFLRVRFVFELCEVGYGGVCGLWKGVLWFFLRGRRYFCFDRWEILDVASVL